ncbi:MAG: hypothetical protein K2K45_07610 [Muribaculaceae bacterium]|nr:hypothetical protein [Muribaculaceae bacterium]
MKDKLTVEESTRLIELGVDAKLASKHTLGVQIPTDIPNVYRKIDGGEPIFTLADLISILPKEIDCYYLNISAYMAEWCVSYERTSCCDIFEIKCSRSAPELIDALYQLAIYVLENFPNENHKN